MGKLHRVPSNSVRCMKVLSADRHKRLLQVLMVYQDGSTCIADVDLWTNHCIENEWFHRRYVEIEEIVRIWVHSKGIHTFPY